MSAALALRTFVVFGLLGAGCSPPPPGSPPSTSAGGGAGAGGAPSQAGAGGAEKQRPPEVIDSGVADAGAEGVLPLTPGGSSVPTSVAWKVVAEALDPGIFVSSPTAASRGQDAAVAYLERADTPPSSRIVMQRFDANGERIGSLVELGKDPDQGSAITLASDGKQYAACWTSSLEVHCALVDEQGNVHSDALELSGQSPKIVASPGGWAIGYAASDAQLRLQALTPALAPSGSPVDLQFSQPFRSLKLSPLLARTAAGFALVGMSLENGHDCLQRLGPDLHPVGSPTPLGRDAWFTAQLVASDTRTAVSLSAPYGAYLLLLEGEKLTAELPMSGGGKTGMDHAMLPCAGGVGAAWLNRDGGVLRRFFADGGDDEIGLATQTSTQSVLGLPEEGTDSYQQLLRVAGQILLIGRLTRGGALRDPSTIRVATLTFP
jgi:hypothetical protein